MAPAKPIVPPMDTGLWTLRCQSCNESFEIELAGGEKIVETAQNHPCPHCHNKPANTGAANQTNAHWHQVIGFRVVKKPR